MLSRYFFYSLLLIICGCAAMNESECRNADWQLIGFEDGSRGKAVSYIGQRRKACAEFNVVPDSERYEQGYAKGIQQYCTAAKGFRLGKSGGEYKGVCPAEYEGDFLSGYHLGRDIHTLQHQLSKINSKLSHKYDELEKLSKQVTQKEKIIISSKTTEKQRASLLDDVKQLQNEIGQLESEVDHLEKKRLITNHELKTLTEQSPF